jgi:hypothetical protein
VRLKRFFALIAIGAVLASVLSVIAPVSEGAEAADSRQFDAGNLISDAQFYDGGSMTAGEVQSFLNSQVSACRSGYTCLKDYRQDTPNRATVSGACAAYQGGAGESAAAIIYKVGVACGISQRAMLVLLQKEQGLVTDTWPTTRQYRSATGYGCPDTADCDAAYYGFFNQVYNAALQFKYYAANPSRWNHVAGQVFNVRISPNAACGTIPVLIQNTATAGLYNYTPYTPNAAALANLYGTGDSCSAYGNRNFWRIYSDWFGSPTVASSLLRTNANPNVYLVSGSSKYLVRDSATLTALGPLGGVAFVSEMYLSSFDTRHPVARSLRSPGGAIYLYDAGFKLPFTSCTQAEDYGASCADDGYVQLTDIQLRAFITGPALTPVLSTAEGSRYFISQGIKREVLDDQSLQAASIPVAGNRLTEGAVSALALGAPVIRDSALVSNRSSGEVSLLTGGSRQAINADYASSLSLAGKTAGKLSAASLSKLATLPTPFNGMITVAGTPGAFLLAGAGRYQWDSAVNSYGVPATTVTSGFRDQFPSQGAITPGTMIKPTDARTVYMTMESDIRPIESWEGMLALSTTDTPTILRVPAAITSTIPKGPVALTAGRLVRTPDNRMVYLINGVTDKIAFMKFDFPFEAGFTEDFLYTTPERLNAYPIAGAQLTFGIVCGGTSYVSAGGSLHAVRAGRERLFPFSFVTLDRFTCGQVRVGSPATDFIRLETGKIYQLVDGQKRPVQSMSRWAEINGGQTWLSVVPKFADMIPTGPAA